MAVASTLDGSVDASESSSFGRFWDRLVFLAKQTAGDRVNDDSVLHGLLLSNAPLNCYQAALMLHPEAA